MGVRGLTGYLQSDPRNFKELELHNTVVIFDASNFVHYLYFKSALYTQFNGEYANFRYTVIKVLHALRRCAIKPIFIFDGCHKLFKLKCRLDRNHWRMQTVRNFCNLITTNQHNFDATNPNISLEILPPLAILLLAQVLEQMHIDYVTCDRESDQNALSLAIYLNCPVVSGDSDFYVSVPINRNESTIGVCFIPIQYLHFDPVCSPQPCYDCSVHKKTCMYLQCRRFMPSGPGFGQLPAVQRPLLASLMGNDIVDQNKFLHILPIGKGLTLKLAKYATKQMCSKRRTSIIRSLIKWLLGFGQNVEQPIDYIVNNIAKEERSRLKQILLDSVKSYATHPELTYKLFRDHLFIDDLVADNQKLNGYLDLDKTITSPSSTPIDQSSLINDKSFHTLHNETIMNSDSNLNHLEKAMEDVTLSWPDSLRSAYRKYLISPNLLDCIYSDGLVLLCGIESLKDSASIHSSALELRRLVYSLILGKELSLCTAFRDNSKLVGVRYAAAKYTVTEYCRKGKFCLKPKYIAIEPIALSGQSISAPLSDTGCNNNHQQFTVFMRDHSGVHVKPDKPDSWIDLVAVISAVNTGAKFSTVYNTNQITQCSIVLAFGAICVCAYMLEQFTDMNKASSKKVKDHYFECTNYFRTLSDENHSFVLSIVHAYGALQSTYLTLYTLVNLVKALADPLDKEKHLDLPSSVTLFPSGHLFYETVRFLQSVRADNRCECVENKILQKLMSFNPNSGDLFEGSLKLFQSYLIAVVDVHANIVSSHCNGSESLDRCCQETKPEIAVSNFVATSPKSVSKKRKQLPKITKRLTNNQVTEEAIIELMLQNALLDD